MILFVKGKRKFELTQVTPGLPMLQVVCIISNNNDNNNNRRYYYIFT